MPAEKSSGPSAQGQGQTDPRSKLGTANPMRGMQQPGPSRGKGFCSPCQAHYNNVQQHVLSPKHREATSKNKEPAPRPEPAPRSAAAPPPEPAVGPPTQYYSMLEKFLSDIRTIDPRSYEDSRPTYDDLPEPNCLLIPREDHETVIALKDGDRRSVGTRDGLSDVSFHWDAGDEDLTVATSTSQPQEGTRKGSGTDRLTPLRPKQGDKLKVATTTSQPQKGTGGGTRTDRLTPLRSKQGDKLTLATSTSQPQEGTREGSGTDRLTPLPPKEGNKLTLTTTTSQPREDTAGGARTDRLTPLPPKEGNKLTLTTTTSQPRESTGGGAGTERLTPLRPGEGVSPPLEEARTPSPDRLRAHSPKPSSPDRPSPPVHRKAHRKTNRRREKSWSSSSSIYPPRATSHMTSQQEEVLNSTPRRASLDWGLPAAKSHQPISTQTDRCSDPEPKVESPLGPIWVHSDPVGDLIEEVIQRHCYGRSPAQDQQGDSDADSFHLSLAGSLGGNSGDNEDWDTHVQVVLNSGRAEGVRDAPREAAVAWEASQRMGQLYPENLEDHGYISQLDTALNHDVRAGPKADENRGEVHMEEILLAVRHIPPNHDARAEDEACDKPNKEEIKPAPCHNPQSFLGKVWAHLEDDQKVEAMVQEFRQGCVFSYFDQEPPPRSPEHGCDQTDDRAWDVLPLMEHNEDPPEGTRRRKKKRHRRRVQPRCQVIKEKRSIGTQTTALVAPVVRRTTLNPAAAASDSHPLRQDSSTGNGVSTKTPQTRGRLSALRLPPSYSRIMTPLQPKTSLLLVLSSPDARATTDPKPRVRGKGKKTLAMCNEAVGIKITYKRAPLRYYDPATNRILKNAPAGLLPGAAKPHMRRQLFRSLSPDVNSGSEGRSGERRDGSKGSLGRGHSAGSGRSVGSGRSAGSVASESTRNRGQGTTDAASSMTSPFSRSTLSNSSPFQLDAPAHKRNSNREARRWRQSRKGERGQNGGQQQPLPSLMDEARPFPPARPLTQGVAARSEKLVVPHVPRRGRGRPPRLAPSPSATDRRLAPPPQRNRGQSSKQVVDYRKLSGQSCRRGRPPMQKLSGLIQPSRKRGRPPKQVMSNGTLSEPFVESRTFPGLATPPTRNRAQSSKQVVDYRKLSGLKGLSCRRGRPPTQKLSGPIQPPRRRGRPPMQKLSGPIQLQRKRGRPPKQVVSNGTLSERDSPPRKRGRPSKLDVDVCTLSEPDSLPRKRGRPPKRVVNNGTLSEPDSPPRKRGRPRKQVEDISIHADPDSTPCAAGQTAEQVMDNGILSNPDSPLCREWQPSEQVVDNGTFSQPDLPPYEEGQPSNQVVDNSTLSQPDSPLYEVGQCSNQVVDSGTFSQPDSLPYGEGQPSNQVVDNSTLSQPDSLPYGEGQPSKHVVDSGTFSQPDSLPYGEGQPLKQVVGSGTFSQPDSLPYEEGQPSKQVVDNGPLSQPDSPLCGEGQPSNGTLFQPDSPRSGAGRPSKKIVDYRKLSGLSSQERGQPQQQVVESIKKRKGRPPKLAIKNRTLPGPSSPLLQGRGRPKKLLVDYRKFSGETLSSHREGQPPKQVEESKILPKLASPLPRGRGRPPKLVAESGKHAENASPPPRGKSRLRLPKQGVDYRRLSGLKTPRREGRPSKQVEESRKLPGLASPLLPLEQGVDYCRLSGLAPKGVVESRTLPEPPLTLPRKRGRPPKSRPGSDSPTLPSEHGEVKQTLPPPPEHGDVNRTLPPPPEDGEVKRTFPPPSEDGEVKRTLPPPSEDAEVKQTLPPPSEDGDVKQTLPPPLEPGDVNRTLLPSSEVEEVKRTLPPPPELGEVNRIIPSPPELGEGNRTLPRPPLLHQEAHSEEVIGAE